MESLNINSPALIAEMFKPKKYSLKWLWFKIKADLRKSYILKFLKFVWRVIIGIRAQFLIVMSKLVKDIIAISNGMAIIYELVAVAFFRIIDRELWDEIKNSQFAKQALGIGVLTTIVWFLYSLQLQHFSIYAIIFLTYQGFRLLRFLGMEPSIIKESEVEAEMGARRSIKSMEEILEEKEEDDEPYGIY